MIRPIVCVVSITTVVVACARTIASADGDGLDGGSSARVPADASLDEAADGDGEADADADETPGTFGHCCVDDQLLSCFCPAGASCNFGSACSDGGCVAGDGAACAERDARGDED